MKILTLLAASAALTAPLAAQGSTLLSEPFSFSSTGVFPPTSWTTQDAGTAPYVWVEAGSAFTSLGTMLSDAAAHEYSFLVQCESYLLSPKLDFSSAPAPGVEFDLDIYWILYMAHTGSIGGGLANGEQHVRVSTDGGVTFSSPVYTFAGTADGLYLDEFADLSAYAGNSSVHVVFHYSGDFAHDAGIDNVDVMDGGSAGPSLALSGTCPGSITADASGMTPNGPVGFGWGFAGSSVIAAGPCAGAALPVSNPTVLAIVLADANGDASLTGNAPANACGNALVVAVDGATCTATGPMVL